MKNIVLPDFSNVDFYRLGNALKNKQPMIVIYNNPKDYPDNYVARLWTTGLGVPRPSPYIALKDTLGEIRAAVPPGMVRLDSDVRDDPVIVETWI